MNRTKPASVGDRLYAYNEAQPKPMSIKALAGHLGVSYESLRKWKEGDTSPNRNRAEKIAAVIGCSVGWLLNGEPASGAPEQLRRNAHPTATEAPAASPQALRWAKLYDEATPEQRRKLDAALVVAGIGLSHDAEQSSEANVVAASFETKEGGGLLHNKENRERRKGPDRRRSNNQSEGHE